MEKCKRAAVKLLFPHKAIVAVLVIVSAAGLIYVFTNQMENHPLAFLVYPLSFYTLCTVIALIPNAVRKGKNGIFRIPFAAKYLTEQELRFRVSLYNSTTLNLAFGVFKLTVGIVFHSVWFGAVGVYYMVLSVTRFLLVKKDRSLQANKSQSELPQWYSYRISGAFLLLLNASMSGIVFLSVQQNHSYVYPGFIIYASAAYTFYRLTMAIIHNIKLRSHSKPLFRAAKTMDLSAALMSIFALQTAMFTTFGTETDESVRQLMNALTGGSVCLIVVCMAIYMLIRAHKEIKAFNKE